jgi:Cyclin, N-terminal domain
MSVQLLCADVCPEMVPLARADRAILDDSRVLSQLLRTEMHSVPSVDYFECKSELQPYMRRVVTTWMLEVCVPYANEPVSSDFMQMSLTNFLDFFFQIYANEPRNFFVGLSRIYANEDR